MDLGNIIEVVFKEKPADFVEANEQFTRQFNTKVVRVIR